VKNAIEEYEVILSNSQNIQLEEALNIAKTLVGANYVIQDYVEKHDGFFGFYYRNVDSKPYLPGLPGFWSWDGGSLFFMLAAIPAR
jgi:hypothetical protein